MRGTRLPWLLLTLALTSCAANETLPIGGSLPNVRPIPAALKDRSVLTGPGSVQRTEDCFSAFERELTAAQR